MTPEVIHEAEEAIRSAWNLAAYGSIPPPLFASPKCAGCSLAPICLPDEVTLLRSTEPDEEQLDLFSDGSNLNSRNHIEPDARVLSTLKDLADRAQRSRSLEELLGLKGNAARLRKLRGND